MTDFSRWATANEVAQMRIVYDLGVDLVDDRLDENPQAERSDSLVAARFQLGEVSSSNCPHPYSTALGEAAVAIFQRDIGNEANPAHSVTLLDPARPASQAHLLGVSLHRWSDENLNQPETEVDTRKGIFIHKRPFDSPDMAMKLRQFFSCLRGLAENSQMTPITAEQLLNMYRPAAPSEAGTSRD